MQSIIESGIVDLLRLALDASIMRQQAIAHNIANANTPGYQRMGVSFEAQVAQLMDQQKAGTPTLPMAALRPEFVSIGQEPVSLDTEMASLAENTLHHQALLKALSKQMSLVSTAINEGKR